MALSTFLFPDPGHYLDLGLLILRIAVAVIFAYHAYTKLTKSGMMAKGMGWNPAQVVLLGLWEMIGALSLLLGVYAQIGAAMLGIVMLGALHHKIFKWKVAFASQTGTGWEFDMILLASNILILLTGAGAFALLP